MATVRITEVALVYRIKPRVINEVGAFQRCVVCSSIELGSGRC